MRMVAEAERMAGAVRGKTKLATANDPAAEGPGTTNRARWMCSDRRDAGSPDSFVTHGAEVNTVPESFGTCRSALVPEPRRTALLSLAAPWWAVGADLVWVEP